MNSRNQDECKRETSKTVMLWCGVQVVSGRAMPVTAEGILRKRRFKFSRVPDRVSRVAQALQVTTEDSARRYATPTPLGIDDTHDQSLGFAEV